MNRKDFLKSGALIAGGILLQGHKYFLRNYEQPAGFKIVRDNLGIFNERGGTMGWYVSKDAVVVIDSQFPESAKNFYNGLKTKTDRKIDFLMNTHHHRDHTGGNYFLKEFASKIVSSEKTKELQQKFNGNDPNNPQAYADITFDKEWTLDIGAEKLKAMQICSAHTAGDVIIHFENSNVVHMGDLVFNKVYPVIDLPGGSDLRGWIEYLDKSLSLFDKETIYIFGHAQTPEGVIGKASDLIEMRNYINALLVFVESEIKSGKTKDEIASANTIPNVEGVKEMWAGAMKRNIEAAVEYLSKDK
jgi:glyoxylase-like metal-dependent hydrolase (beta-lactamase superfamily II)